MKKYNNLLMIGLILMALILIAVIAGPLLLNIDPLEMSPADRIQAPSAQHWLGTDEFGRDLLSRILHGGRLSLYLGVIITFFSISIGTIIGLYSAHFPRFGDVIMRICDGLMAIPGLLLAIALMSAFGPAISNIIIALVIVYVPATARLVRSRALQVENQAYISAMRIIGASHNRIIWRHVFPNVIPSLSIQMNFIFAGTIISEAALSYLGAGVPIPTASWGNIIQGGKTVIFQGWWIVLFPSLAVLLSVITLHMIGEGLRIQLNPRARQRA